MVAEGLRPKDLSRSDTPFLFRLQENVVLKTRVRGAPGEQCWGELFTGAWPERTGGPSAWTLNCTNGLPAGASGVFLYRLLDALPHRVRGWSARIPRWGSEAGGLPHFPRALRWGLRGRLLATDDPAAYLQPGRSRIPSLSDSLVAAGRRMEYTAFPTRVAEEKRWISRLGFMARAFLDHHDVYLARLPGGDSLMLQHGPGSPERNQVVRELDGLVERLVTRFRRQWAEGVVVVVSLRGSVAARTYFDAESRLVRLAHRRGLLPYRDYACLTGRTMLRAWAMNANAREFFNSLAEDDRNWYRNGTLLTPELAARHHLPPPKSAAGDWIWFARPGMVLFPNDFDLRRSRAACGYLHPDVEIAQLPSGAGTSPTSPLTPTALSLTTPEEKSREDRLSDEGFLLVSDPARNRTGIGAEFASEINRVDLCATLAELAGVRVPAASQGRGCL
jgi:hypothetical protein